MCSPVVVENPMYLRNFCRVTYSQTSWITYSSYVSSQLIGTVIVLIITRSIFYSF